MHAIHNARIQLLATALNNLGVGAILAGVIVPSINGTGMGRVGLGSYAIYGSASRSVHRAIPLGKTRQSSARPAQSAHAAYRGGRTTPPRLGGGVRDVVP
jgi:hypothetical protein